MKKLTSMKISEVNKRLAHVEICFNKRQLDNGDVYRRVTRWIHIRGSFIAENSHVSEVVKSKVSIGRRAGESTEPYSR